MYIIQKQGRCRCSGVKTTTMTSPAPSSPEEMYKSLIQEIVIHDERIRVADPGRIIYKKKSKQKKKGGYDVIQKTA